MKKNENITNTESLCKEKKYFFELKFLSCKVEVGRVKKHMSMSQSPLSNYNIHVITITLPYKTG